MKDNKPKVILLVAGEGKRLRPYTSDRPKCMVEVNGISLIDRQLAVLRAEGLEDIMMIGGYKAEMLRKFNTKLKINPRYYNTNMLWTLFCAEEELEGDVIVSYGDIVYSRKILQALMQSTADIAVIIDKEWESYWRARNEDPLDDAETLKLRDDGAIIEIGQKPKSLNEIEGQYIGLMKFSAKGIKQIREIFHTAIDNSELLGRTVESAYMTDILQAAANLGKLVKAIPVYSSWIEIDTVDDLMSDVVIERLKKIDHA
jgi:L-glutamine-phosphate cytidylyltransferase